MPAQDALGHGTDSDSPAVQHEVVRDCHISSRGGLTPPGQTGTTAAAALTQKERRCYLVSS